ncbi:MAG: O-antigen ligase family protein [Gammaproteobacteria bacterium]|nr:O-antigen ligase family protein [Gammaproteobacteria bacterium]
MPAQPSGRQRPDQMQAETWTGQVRHGRPALGLRARLGPRDLLHPTAYGTVLLILVAIGRLPELVPPLAALQPGNLAVVLAVIGLAFGRRLPVAVFAAPMGKLMLVFTALAALSVGFSVWGSHSLQALLSGFAAGVLLFYLAAKTAASPATYRAYVAALLVAASVLAISAVILGAERRAEVTSMYDPNDLALVLVACLPFAAVRVFATQGKRRWAFLALTAVFAVGVLATGSRGGFLGLMAVTGFLLFKEMPVRGRFGFAAKIAVLLLVGSVALALTHDTVWQRIASLANLEQDYNISSDRGRLAIWGRALHTISERPWGVGLMAFAAAEGVGGGNYQEAHNALIQVAAELGLLGLLVYVGFYLNAFRSLARRYETPPGSAGPPDLLSHELMTQAVALRAALVGFFVTSFFLSKAYSPLFFLLLGLTLATTLRLQVAAGVVAPRTRRRK